MTKCKWQQNICAVVNFLAMHNYEQPQKPVFFLARIVILHHIKVPRRYFVDGEEISMLEKEVSGKKKSLKNVKESKCNQK